MDRRMSSQRFGKARRVRRSGDYQRAFKAGARVHGRFFTLVAAPNEASVLRLGIVASRKLGNAVTRNRAKRLIRDVFRRPTLSASQPGIDIVVIPRAGMVEAPYSSLHEDFRGTLKRAISRVSANAPR
jgi:ribonuclease P protein component